MIKKIFIAFCFALVLAGCIPVASKKSNVTKGEEFLKGKIIDGFPNVPLYPKSKAIETFGQGEKYGGTFYNEEKLAEVINFYSTTLVKTGWESTLRQVSANNFVFDIKSSKRVGSIIVNTAADGKHTAITISLGPR